MKFLLSVFLSLAALGPIVSQQTAFDVRISKDFDHKRFSDMYLIRGYDDPDGFICMREDPDMFNVKNDLTFEKFDADGNHQGTFPVTWNGERSSVEFKAAIRDEEFVSLVLKRKSESKSESEVLVQKYKVSDLTPSGNAELLMSVEIGESKGGERGSIEVLTSTDGTMLGVAGKKATADTEQVEIRYQVYGSRLELIGEQESRLEHTTGNFRIEEWLMGNSGDLYIYSNVFDSPTSTPKKKDTSINLFWRMSPTLDRVDEVELSMQGHDILNPLVYEDESTIVIGGRYDNLYLDPDGATRSLGAYLYVLKDDDLSILTSSTDPYGPELLTKGRMPLATKVVTKEFKKNKYSPLADLDTEELRKTANGDYLIMFENTYSKVTNSGDFRYYGVALIISSFDVSGHVNWSQNVMKRQFSKAGYRFFGAELFLTDDRAYLFYNDRLENNYGDTKDEVYGSQFKGNESSAMSMVTLDIKTGEQDREAVFPESDKGWVASIPAHRLSEDRLLFYMRDGVKARFVTLSQE